MLAVVVSPRGFTTALVSEASIVPRASHHEITLVACLGRVLGAEPQVGCRLIDSHSYSYSFVSHPSSRTGQAAFTASGSAGRQCIFPGLALHPQQHRYVLFASPWTPSPSPGRSPRHLAPTRPLLPLGFPL